jgi:hypothetical protein
MKTIFFLIGFFVAPLGFSQETEIEIVIAAEKVACIQQQDQSCFKAKKTTDPYWTFQIESIQGFEYEEGSKYQLKVIVQPPTALGEQPTYTLVAIVEQQKID